MCQIKSNENENKNNEIRHEKDENNENNENPKNVSNHCTQYHSFEANDELPLKQCVLRKCSECGVNKYKEIISGKNTNLLNSKDIIKWKQWEKVPYEQDGEKKSEMGDNVKTGTIQDLLDHYIKQLHDMSVHQFSKVWQLKQFNACVKNLKPGQVLFVHDFSQNLLLY